MILRNGCEDQQIQSRFRHLYTGEGRARVTEVMRALTLPRSPFAIIALWILLAITPRASEAMMAPGDLADIFDRADAVVLATVVSSEMHEWDRNHRETSVCGYTVKIRIKESYSGGYEGEIKVGSSTSLVPDGTYLLYLNRRSVFVGTDVVDQSGEAAETRKAKCLSKTPQLKAKQLGHNPWSVPMRPCLRRQYRSKEDATNRLAAIIFLKIG